MCPPYMQEESLLEILHLNLDEQYYMDEWFEEAAYFLQVIY